APQVYRLLSRKTYEMHMFQTANRKLGLDQAVLRGSKGTKGESQGPSKAEV
ncbi:unnamed protein product, partial [Discosporangium mesarthrocarpum]